MECDWIKVLAGAVAFLKDVLVPVTAVVIAAMGLSTWRNQLRGTTRHSAAVKAMREVIALRNAIRRVRRVRIFSIPAEQIGQRVEVIQTMYTQHRPLLASTFAAQDALELAELDAAVFFGEDEVHAALEPLYAAVREYSVNFEEFYQEELRRAESGERRTSDGVQVAKVVRGQDDDEFDRKLQQGFDEAKEFFAPHVR